MTKKLCTYVGCKTIVEHDDDGSSPRCELHPVQSRVTQEERQRKYEHHYDEKGRNMYSLYRWKKLRAQKVAQNPICEHCELVGVAKPVQEVDHIIEIDDGGEFWEITNLQSLCKRHHIIKTNKAKAERGRKKDDFGYFL